MVADGLEEKCEILLAEVDQRAAQGRSEPCAPFAVTGVTAVILTTAVMQKREEFHDELVRTGVPGQAQSVFPYSLPVRETVNASHIEGKSLLRALNHLAEVGSIESWCRHRFLLNEIAVGRQFVEVIVRFGTHQTHPQQFDTRRQLRVHPPPKACQRRGK
jgi:hypothetical protein